ncbi:hypothetical protein PR202_gb13916 [Eleusine coracana subsp. coracana]|uniref:PIG-P domain-containing protein n=1 Tax=Eleusine coracana subsp. coracana TaxID=191504 RepID=A0AAV5ETX3_ELECO|nr:hypothetical protein PR202_gb13916 [Eleusine coracana subsp. coracana]
MAGESDDEAERRRSMDWPSPPPTSPSLVVRSPRQTVGLLRNRRRHRDPFPRSPSFAAGDHGPKPSEVYGFVGSITTVIATAVYLAWAYMPEPWLHSLGITYYPSKYWALAVPSFVIVAVALSMAIYMGFNFLATPPPTSFNTIFDLIENVVDQGHCSDRWTKAVKVEATTQWLRSRVNKLIQSFDVPSNLKWELEPFVQQSIWLTEPDAMPSWLPN